MRKRIIVLLTSFVLFGCNNDDDNQIHDIGSLDDFLKEKSLQKIIYNDFRNTVWLVVSSISDDPSKGYLCGTGAFDYHLIKIQGDKIEVAEKFPMIYDWTICQKNNLWVLSENQVKQIIDMDKPFSVFTEEDGSFLNSLVADSQGNLWASGSNGVLKMDENLNWTRYTPENSVVPSLNTKQMVIGNDDTKWVSFDDGNLSLLRINDESWDHFICENDGPYCQSSTLCDVNEEGDLMLSYYQNEIAAITIFNGETYEDIFILDDDGNNMNGRFQMLKLDDDIIYALVYSHETTTSTIHTYVNESWSVIYTSKFVSDFELVENEMWILDMDEGLVKIAS